MGFAIKMHAKINSKTDLSKPTRDFNFDRYAS